MIKTKHKTLNVDEYIEAHTKPNFWNRHPKIKNILTGLGKIVIMAIIFTIMGTITRGVMYYGLTQLKHQNQPLMGSNDLMFGDF